MFEIILLYLFTRVDAIAHGFGVLSVVTAIASGTFLIAMAVAFTEHSEYAGVLKKWVIGLAIVSSVAGGLHVLTPRQKDLAIIVGGYVAVQAITSPTAKKIYSAIEAMLDDALADLVPKKGKKE